MPNPNHGIGSHVQECTNYPFLPSPLFRTTLTKMLDGVKSKIPDARYQEILQRIRLDIKSSDELGALKKQRPRSFKMQMAENQKHLRNIAEMIELEGRAAGGGGSSSAAAPPPQQAHQHAAPASRPAGPRPAVSAGSSFPEMPAFGDFSDPWFADARRSLETDPWFAGARSALLAPSLPTPSRAQRGATLPSQAASSSNTAPSEQFIILHALPAHLNRLNGEKVKGRRVAGEPAFKLSRGKLKVSYWRRSDLAKRKAIPCCREVRGCSCMFPPRSRRTTKECTQD